MINPIRRVEPALSVARFLWLMAGGNLVDDMVSYDPGVSRFSDDGKTIPGSSFGHRMLHRASGNQLEAVIHLLRSDPHTRRAVISVYDSLDCGRDSNDIPCVLNLAYLLREGCLHATHIFRSNNSFRLFPHNFFEFSLLAEVIACELSVSLATVTHYALSMHLYENDYARAEQSVKAADKERDVDLSGMEMMPVSPSPREEICRLIVLERELRKVEHELQANDVEQLILKASNLVNNYWSQFYFVLLHHKIGRRADDKLQKIILNALQEPWYSWCGR